MVLRRDREIVIFRNSCPHTRESLDPMGGSVASDDGQLIHCQRHAAVFLASTGECVGGPCQGESLDPVCTARDRNSSSNLVLVRPFVTPRTR